LKSFCVASAYSQLALSRWRAPNRSLASRAVPDSNHGHSREGWGQLVPNNFQSRFILTGDGPSPPLLVRILESAVSVFQPARISFGKENRFGLIPVPCKGPALNQSHSKPPRSRKSSVTVRASRAMSGSKSDASALTPAADVRVADVMSDVTRLLHALQAGESSAADELLPLIYAELRRLAAAKMAREQPGHTLQPTALVHEAWLRLGDGVFENRAHFFSAAAEAMRRILVESARRKHREKRGAGAEHVDADELEIAAPQGNAEESIAVHEALDRLAAHDARKAEVVKLRYFVGFSFEETAEVLGVSVPTAKRDWAYARAWLHQEIGSNTSLLPPE